MVTKIFYFFFQHLFVKSDNRQIKLNFDSNGAPYTYLQSVLFYMKITERFTGKKINLFFNGSGLPDRASQSRIFNLPHSD